MGGRSISSENPRSEFSKLLCQTIFNCGREYYVLCDSTIENPVYGVDKKAFVITEPYLPGSVDVMAVSNLPNELPRDASRYFGEQIIKYLLKDIVSGGSEILDKATIVKTGKLSKAYDYMKDYAGL